MISSRLQGELEGHISATSVIHRNIRGQLDLLYIGHLARKVGRRVMAGIHIYHAFRPVRPWICDVSDIRMPQYSSTDLIICALPCRLP